MKMKPILMILLALCLLFSGCNSSGINAGGVSTDAALQESRDTQPAQSEPATGGATITIYPETSLGDESPPLTLDDTVTLDGDYIIYGPLTFSQTARIIDGKYTYCLEVYAYEGDAEVVEIPAEVSGCPVVAIGSEVLGRPCFQGNTQLKKVVIPDTIEYIGCYAFDGCVNLEEVNIPDSVTSIGDHAFSNCTSLKELTIPASVKDIGSFAFTDCAGLKEFRITPDMYVHENALYFASELETLIIEDGVTVAPSLSGRVSLTELYLPDSITSIESFSGCIFLKSVRLSGGVEEYTADYSYPLFDSTEVSFIDVGEGVSSLGSYVFGNATLESIILPSTLTDIEEDIFYRITLSPSCEDELVAAPLKEVFFRGTEDQCIQELKDQAEEVGATVYYLSETEPTVEGNFWHYVDGKPVIW